jgi:uncharacterized repeat protein (TIGR02543 family)
MFKKLSVILMLTLSIGLVSGCGLFDWLETKNSYTINFVTNGGTIIEEIQVEEGDFANAPQDPTKQNYSFTGWFLDDDLEQPFDFLQEIIEANLTLYAGWQQEEQYTLTFDGAGADTIEFVTKEIYFNGQIGQLPTVSKQGYSFLGWAIEGQIINSQTIWQYLSTQTAVAEWEVSQYTVTFNANGGTIVGDSQLTAEYGNPLTNMPQDPQRDLWVFEGWSNVQESDVNRDEGSIITENETWYAVWHFIDTYTQPLLMSNYLYNTQEKVNKETEFAVRDDYYYVGYQNEFVFAPEVRLLKNNDVLELEGYSSEVIIEIFEDGQYIELLSSNNFSDYVIIDNKKPAFQFNSSAIDKLFRITLVPAGFTRAQLEILLIEEIIFEFKVIDAWNVYTVEDLSKLDSNTVGNDWENYKTVNNVNSEPINGIVLHSNILITANDIPQSYMYSQQDEINDGSQVAGSLKDRTSIYVLVKPNQTQFNFIGNYFTINASEIPLVQKDSEGGNSQTGLISHATLFGFAGDDSNAPANPDRYIGEVYVKNTYFIGNSNRSENLALSGGFTLFRTTSEKFTMDNVIVRSILTILVPLGEWVDIEGNTEIINEVYVINSKGYDSFSVMFYVWAADVVMINSEFKRAGGPIIINTHRNNNISRHTSHYSTLKTYNTYLDNTISGDEAWFALNGAATIATDLKAIAGLIDVYANNLQAAGFSLDSTSLLSNDGGLETLQLIGVIMTSSFPAYMSSPLLGNLLINVEDEQNHNNYGADKFNSNYQLIQSMLPKEAPIFQSSNGGFATVDFVDGNYHLMIFNGTGFINIATATPQELMENAQFINQFFSGDYITMFTPSSSSTEDSRMAVVLRFN